MRSPRKILQESIRRLCADEQERYLDMGARVRVYRRGPDRQATPCEWMPDLWGGQYDTLAGGYVGPPRKWSEFKIHSGQIPLIEAIGGPCRRVLGIGGQGSGKSQGNVTVAALMCLARPHSVGGIVAPVGHMRTIAWKKFLALVEPLGWVAHISLQSNEIGLHNGALVQFRAAKKSASSAGSPIAGLDWSWAVEEEQCYLDSDAIREVDARGRINKHYQVFSSATNEPIHDFQMRVLEYEQHPRRKVIRFSGPENCFTPTEHWDALKNGGWSEEDYQRYIEGKDIPREGRVFPAFAYAESVAPLPPPAADITARITHEKYGTPYEYVVGWDPGVITTASVIMKAFAGAGRDERDWYVLDEVTTRDSTTDFHALALIRWFRERGIPVERALVIGDPHENKEADRSDYLQMANAGIHVKRSNGGEQIERKHRIAMTNALLRDASGRRRLKLVAAPSGAPVAKKTAECLGHLMYRPNGEIDYRHKTAANLAHWGEAMGYGLFPFERFRGAFYTKHKQPAQVTHGPWRGRVGA